MHRSGMCDYEIPSLLDNKIVMKDMQDFLKT